MLRLCFARPRLLGGRADRYAKYVGRHLTKGWHLGLDRRLNLAMESWSVLPEKSLAAAGPDSESFLRLGISSFRNAARHLNVSRLSASRYPTLQALLDGSETLRAGWRRDGNRVIRR